MGVNGTTPVEGIEVVRRESNGFLRVPSIKTLLAWFALGGAVLTVGGFVFLRAGIYETDQKAQAAVNAKVDKTVEIVTVRLGTLQQQVEQNRSEQAQQNQVLSHKLDRLIERRP